MATPDDAFEDFLVLLLCIAIVAAVVLPMRWAVRRGIRGWAARTFGPRTPPAPQQQLLVYTQHQYQALPNSIPPGPGHSAAAPVGGHVNGTAGHAAVVMGYPVSSSNSRQHPPAAPPATAVAAQPSKLVSASCGEQPEDNDVSRWNR